jgi:hypothetical protein
LCQGSESDLTSGNIPQGRNVIDPEGTKKSADESKRLSSSASRSKAMKSQLGSIGPQQLIGHDDCLIGV